VRKFFGQTGGGFSEEDVALFGAKDLDFSKFIVRPHGQGG